MKGGQQRGLDRKTPVVEDPREDTHRMQIQSIPSETQRVLMMLIMILWIAEGMRLVMDL